MRAGSGRTVLAVFAHPDDETLLAGALIAKLVNEGWRVHLLCLAPGDDDDLSARMELAADDLGIASVSSLRFAPAAAPPQEDGTVSSPPLLSAPESAVISQVAGKLAELSPDMIITHSPEGDYGHPDHACCHRVTVAAAQEAAPDAAVYAFAWSRLMLRLNRSAGRFFEMISIQPWSSSGGDDETGKAPQPARLPVAETHNVGRLLAVRKRASRHYRKEIAKGPPPMRMLEAAPTWLQRLVLGKQRLSRIR